MLPDVRLPPAVAPGDRVGVAALSGTVDAERLARGLAELERLGLRPVPARNLALRDGIFAGDDDVRLAALHELAADGDLRAVVFARGGHGVLRLLPRIDWELLSRYPRAWIGYSDLTPFLSEVVERLGLVAFHGPMVTGDLGRGLAPGEESSFLDALAGRLPSRLPLDRLEEGADGATGPLAGGCLSLLAATLGTPFQRSLAGRLLFWEDVGEPLYRIDRMLTQLRLSGTLAGIRAMVVGRVEPADGPRRGRQLRRLVREHAAALGAPLAWGLPSGHTAPNLTLPLGLPARIEEDGDRGHLTVGLPPALHRP